MLLRKEKINIGVLLGLVVGLGVFVFGSLVLAAGTAGGVGSGATGGNNGYYKLHENIPGQTGVTTLQQYLEGLYKFGISIVAILAVVMIAVGAFMYIVTSAGNAAKLANAKEIITSAILGLVMALLAWLILFVINPDLVQSGLKFQKIKIETYVVGDGRPDWMCDQPSVPFYEKGPCVGDKFCNNNQCVYKKDICPINMENTCDNKLLAGPGQPCGPVKAGSNTDLLGKCIKAERSCNILSTGKQCYDSVCCAKQK